MLDHVCGWVMSWMQSNVVTTSTEPSSGSGSSRGSTNRALSTRSLAGVPRPDRGRAARCRSRRTCCSGTPRPSSAPLPRRRSRRRRPSARLQALDEAVERRQHGRQQVGRFHGSKLRSMPTAPSGRGCRSRGRGRCESSRASVRARPSSAGSGGTSPSRTRGAPGRRAPRRLRGQREPLRVRRRSRTAWPRPGCTPTRAPIARRRPARSASSSLVNGPSAAASAS